ncbi:MAG TPA: T9SS type A sorting domain-containing protein [Ignavibacteria bacterium]|nr:T9SS type A sorting domain-containing protein [Ignavibacteria bacterium]
MKKIIFILTLLSSLNFQSLQGQQWRIYNSGNTGMPLDLVGPFALERDSNCTIAWIPTNGLVRFNFQRNSFIRFDSNANYPLASPYSMVVNGHDKWICHAKGLTKFDNFTWTTYTPQNSGIASNLVLDITFDSEGAAWIACVPGLSKFYNGIWKTYNTSNSPLINNRLETISSFGNEVWIGTYSSGLARIIKTPTDTLWKIYTSTNSPLTYNWTDDILIKYPIVYIGLSGGGLNKFNLLDSSWSNYLNFAFLQGIALDTSGNIWMGSPGGGLLKFTKDTTLVRFDPTNSPMPSYSANSVRVDIHQNVWVGTDNGLVIYNENGIVGIDNENNVTIISEDFKLYQNYPNPFNSQTKLKFELKKRESIRLFLSDVTGKIIKEILNETRNPGIYEYNLEMSEFPSGVYFYSLKSSNRDETKKLILLK